MKKNSVEKLKVITIVGARPQFIKASAVSRVIRKKFRSQIREILVHTGQHYDRNMSEVFFRDLKIQSPQYHLGVGSGSHGVMTGKMMAGIEKILIREKPDWVMVYGDTNSTLAGALAAAKLGIPLAHVEAGLRSHNRKMPEEINRVLTDRLANLLFCPDFSSVRNLAKEGIRKGVHFVGDVMRDVFEDSRKSENLTHLPFTKYILCTLHRQENTQSPQLTMVIYRALLKLSRQIHVVFPIHPRTMKVLRRIIKKPYSRRNLRTLGGLHILPPQPYHHFQALLWGSRAVITDSGGVQREARWAGKRCLILRDETEWSEYTLSGGSQVISPHSRFLTKKMEGLVRWKHPKPLPPSSSIAERIVGKLLE